MNAVLSPLNVGLTEKTRSRFKQSRNPSLITQFYVLFLFLFFFCKFLGDFCVYLGGDSFSQRIGKMRRNKKY